MSDVLVRNAAPEDLDALLALWVELAEGRHLSLPGSGERALPVLGRILADPARHLLVAQLPDAGVVGSLDVVIVENVTHGGRPWAVVENVIVSDAYRRRGIGTALLMRALEIARVADCYKAQLHSGKHRVWAHALYRSVGFGAVAEGFKVYFDGR